MASATRTRREVPVQTQLHEPVGSPFPRSPAERRTASRIVLIDEDEENRQLVSEVVTRAGHEVVGHAADGALGVQVTLAERPDLVITSWRMPVMDGVETTRRLRTACPNVAVVALCSLSDRLLCDEFLRAGADACIEKRDIHGLPAAMLDVQRARRVTGPPSAT